jgi:hypothetical protein
MVNLINIVLLVIITVLLIRSIYNLFNIKYNVFVGMSKKYNATLVSFEDVVKMYNDITWGYFANGEQYVVFYYDKNIYSRFDDVTDSQLHANLIKFNGKYYYLNKKDWKRFNEFLIDCDKNLGITGSGIKFLFENFGGFEYYFFVSNTFAPSSCFEDLLDWGSETYNRKDYTFLVEC